jgi:hypothetical protein
MFCEIYSAEQLTSHEESKIFTEFEVSKSEALEISLTSSLQHGAFLTVSRLSLSLDILQEQEDFILIPQMLKVIE